MPNPIGCRMAARIDVMVTARHNAEKMIGFRLELSDKVEAAWIINCFRFLDVWSTYFESGAISNLFYLI